MRLIRPIGLILFALALLGAAPGLVQAQAPFFAGKNIRIIVGLSPGGGYDLYTRTIARHMGKHIPGNPILSVDNMTGAGSLIAANHIYKIAKPDGLTIGHFLGGLFLQQLLGKPGIEFDSQKFEHVGVPGQDNFMLGVAKSTGVTDVEKWLASKQVLKFGGTAVGAGSDDLALMLKHALGLPLQLVNGYKGTADIRLAFNSGELTGLVNAWESTKSTWKRELDSGEKRIILQVTLNPHPDLPKMPLALNLVKNDEDKKLLSVMIRAHGATVRPYVLPPQTPKDRVQILRKAFTDTMKDPEFLADAKKANLDVNPTDGAELEQNVREIAKLEPALVKKLKDILK